MNPKPSERAAPVMGWALLIGGSAFVGIPTGLAWLLLVQWLLELLRG